MQERHVSRKSHRATPPAVDILRYRHDLCGARFATQADLNAHAFVCDGTPLVRQAQVAMPHVITVDLSNTVFDETSSDLLRLADPLEAEEQRREQHQRARTAALQSQALSALSQRATQQSPRVIRVGYLGSIIALTIIMSPAELLFQYLMTGQSPFH